ncbi:hypothetical protein [Actinomadura madurae]|uniref:hypothetical protein n=1 Tax=Actinomadura madurae TaxID=1993 RepID=UPI0020D25C7A|nr:hypothetical protein [Actinomadura madurae]MCQ0006004.1 hypothetical protein [Actinomadura madurae]
MPGRQVLEDQHRVADARPRRPPVVAPVAAAQVLQERGDEQQVELLAVVVRLDRARVEDPEREPEEAGGVAVHVGLPEEPAEPAHPEPAARPGDDLHGHERQPDDRGEHRGRQVERRRRPGADQRDGGDPDRRDLLQERQERGGPAAHLLQVAQDVPPAPPDHAVQLPPPGVLVVADRRLRQPPHQQVVLPLGRGHPARRRPVPREPDLAQVAQPQRHLQQREPQRRLAPGPAARLRQLPLGLPQDARDVGGGRLRGDVRHRRPLVLAAGLEHLGGVGRGAARPEQQQEGPQPLPPPPRRPLPQPFEQVEHPAQPVLAQDPVALARHAPTPRSRPRPPAAPRISPPTPLWGWTRSNDKRIESSC